VPGGSRAFYYINFKTLKNMKLSLSVIPKFVQAEKFCRLFGIGGITLLWWVLHSRPIDEHTYEFKMHERIHSNQQTFLFLLGLAIYTTLNFVCAIFGTHLPWWTLSLPVVLPFILYVLAWLVEILLPPYNRAYRDSVFEREAYINEANHDYTPTIFSVWRYFRGNRKLWEGK
jgi:hypothetical protein